MVTSYTLKLLLFIITFSHLIYVTVSLTVRESIWKDDMQPPFDDSSWSKQGLPTIEQRTDDFFCVENRTANCWRVCGTNSNVNDGYIYRIDSTLGYQNISVTYTVDPWVSIVNQKESCTLWYSIDDQNDNWVQFAGPWTSDDHIEDETTYLPQNTWDNIGVGIKILPVDSNDDCC